MEKIYSIPNKVEGYWNEEAKVVIDKWKSLFITLDEFQSTIFEQGVAHAKKNGGTAWIVDSSEAIGSLNKDIITFIEEELHPAIAKIGVKYFITIPAKSYFTQMSVDLGSVKPGPHNISMIKLKSEKEAIEWLLTH